MGCFGQVLSNEEIDKLFDMSIEELINLKITVASKFEEKITDASNPVTAYSDEDMHNMGLYTIKELAGITSGYSVYSTPENDTWLSTRGTTGSLNSKHLLLIDGIPINHSRAYMAQTENDLPLIFAKRVEFLKGPASALYGVSAFNGIINVISDNLKEEETSRVKIKIQTGTENFETNNDGTLILSKGFMASSLSKSKFGETQISVGYYTRESDLHLNSQNYFQDINQRRETAQLDSHYVSVHSDVSYTTTDSVPVTLINYDTTYMHSTNYDSIFGYEAHEGFKVLDTVTTTGYIKLTQTEVNNGTHDLSSYTLIDTVTTGDDAYYVIKDSIVSREIVRYVKTDTTKNQWDENYSETENRFRNKEQSTFIKASQKFTSGILSGLHLGIIYTHRENGYGKGWTSNSSLANNHEWSSLIPYMKYHKEFGETISIQSYLKYNQSRERGFQANRAGWWTGGAVEANDLVTGADTPTWGTFNFDVLVHNIEGLAEVKTSPINSLIIIAGINYDVRWQDDNQSYTLASNAPANNGFHGGFTKLYGEKAHTYSGYVQVRNEFPILEGLIATIGVRNDNGHLDSEIHSTLSPRASLVQKATKNINIKVSIGRALKAPGIKEISHNKEKRIKIIQHNALYPEKAPYTTLSVIKPEVIQTLEGGITYSCPKIRATYTHFYNATTNVIESHHPVLRYGDMKNGGHIDGTILDSDYFQNSDGTSFAQGGELDIEYATSKMFRLMGNIAFSETWNHNYIGSDNTERKGAVPFAPAWTGNLGTFYNAHYLSTFVCFKYVSGYRAYTSVKNGHYLINANINIPLARYASIDVKLDNILNKEYQNSASTHYMSGRTILIGLTSNF